MEELKHKYVTATYKMFDVTDGAETLLEETPANQPLQLITDMGMLPIAALEQTMADTASGADYELVLKPEEAFGEYVVARVVEIDKAPFDGIGISEGMIVPLQNEQGERFSAQIKKIGEEKVTIDLNHPYAGKTLKFKGTIIDNHCATEDEIMALLNSLHQHSCGGCSGNCGSGNCGSCDGSCDGHHDGEGHCGHCKHHE